MDVPARMDFVNITQDVEEALRESGIREGMCLVNAMHITASVFINDDGPGSGGGRHRRQASFRHVGADLLRGIRREPA